MAVDLELRKSTLEALGWSKRQMGGSWFWYMPNGNSYEDAYARASAENLDLEIENLPAIEADDGIALRELVKFCAGRKVHWEIGSDMCHLGNFTCLIAALDVETCSLTIARAISTALIAAASIKSGIERKE